MVRIDGTDKALALSVDVTPRYVEADPFEGGKQAVAECWRNLTAVGAKPLAVTDNLNFGNPERPEIMGQLVRAIAGIGEACRALDFPVVSGNVSLYNETNGRGILPTPAIGGVGLIEDWRQSATLAFKAEGEAILLAARPSAWGTHLGQSLYLRDILGREEGPPPPVDLAQEKRVGDFVRALILDGLVTAVHDVSDGGPRGRAGRDGDGLRHRRGSEPAERRRPGGRLLRRGPGPLSSSPPRETRLDAPLGALRATPGCFCPGSAIRAATDLKLGDARPVPVAELRARHESWFPRFMGEA